MDEFDGEDSEVDPELDPESGDEDTTAAKVGELAFSSDADGVTWA